MNKTKGVGILATVGIALGILLMLVSGNVGCGGYECVDLPHYETATQDVYTIIGS